MSYNTPISGLNIDINGLTADATPDGTADYVVTYDASAALNKKVLLNNLPTGGGGSGTVTSVSVVSANGFAGTVSAATSTPAISISTTITGILKGNGTSMTTAVSGTDYVIPSGSVATLTTPRTINGVAFDGSANITVPAAAGTLTGTTIGSTVVTSSLTTVGTLTGGATGAGFTLALGTSTITGTLGVPNGGIGVATISGILKGNGTASISTATAGVDYLAPGSVTVFTAQQNFGCASLTDGATISWNLNSAQAATVTLGGNRTLANPTNMQNGGTYTLTVIQDGTGSRTLAYGSAYQWPNQVAPGLSTATNAVDILTFISNGTNMRGNILKAFA